MQHIQINLDFSCPPLALFQHLANHDRLARLLKQNIVRITPSDDPEGIDIVGSIRRIHLGLGLSFDEQVEVCMTPGAEPGRLVYRVVRGSPVKNHRGEIVVTATAAGCHLDYHIQFEPKWPLPGWGGILRWAIQRSLEQPLKRFSATYSASH